MKWLIAQIRKEAWSPYIAGILLGVTGVLFLSIILILIKSKANVNKIRL